MALVYVTNERTAEQLAVSPTVDMLTMHIVVMHKSHNAWDFPGTDSVHGDLCMKRHIE